MKNAEIGLLLEALETVWRSEEEPVGGSKTVENVRFGHSEGSAGAGAPRDLLGRVWGGRWALPKRNKKPKN